MKIAGRITLKPDGSYLIDAGNGPNTYHAHQEATPEAWKAAEKYAAKNPEMVDIYDEQVELDQVEIQQLTTYLESTDWLVVREIETGKPVPAEIKQARRQARDTISAKRGKDRRL